MISRSLLQKYYPASNYDGTKRFYDMVRSHLRKEMIVLNMGCGLPSGNPVKVVKGEVSRVVGADVDPDAASNGEVDEVVIYDGKQFPFEDGFFEAVYSDYVMEHIERPEEFIREVRRVLKPGGMFFFRTPNSYHYVTLLSLLIPGRWKEGIANRTRGFRRGEKKTFPTYYRFNSNGNIGKVARRAGFLKEDIALHFVECEPSYLSFSFATFLLGLAYERLVNKWDSLGFMRANIFGILVKR